MENIFRLTREQKGLSLQKLATEANLSKATIIRTEQGLYPLPSPKLIKALNLSYDTTIPAYRAFQTWTRTTVGHAFFSPNDFHGLAIRSRHNHPFVFLLRGRTVLEFCKAFCMKPDLVNKWVTKPHLVVTIPGPIIEVMAEAGIPEKHIRQLSAEYRRYRDFYTNLQRVQTGLQTNKSPTGGVA